MKWIALVLCVILISLQYRLWFGQSSYQKIQLQQQKIQQISTENQELANRNKKLFAEIEDLRKGVEAVEERARYQLGMIKEGETFFRLLNKDPD
ncbi:cell division protein FtsB [Kangiella sp. TOML190]|uniref:cell division protein FtsB n=1 Tax=Kangiella sp. TOML190 TaxID=2931351 RepID=UPI0020418EFC|nr:cell division protein FtsB [Kangiella sp. TOML190]